MNKNKIKIIHFTQVAGGIQTYIEQIIKYIDTEKFEIILVSPKERDSLVLMAKRLNITWININMKWNISPLNDLISMLEFIKIIRKHKPHLIHSHSSKAGIISRFSSIFFKQKVLFTPNAYAYLGQKGLNKHFFLGIEKISRMFTDILLASSISEKNRSIKDISFKLEKVKVYPNSIEIPIENFSKQYKCNTTVLTAGRLVYQKNPLMFLRVCKIVTDIKPDVIFKIIGAGFEDSLKPEILNFIKDNNLQNNFLIENWMSRNDFLNSIRQASIFVMTSNFESFGYVAAEAAALELPVIATNVDGLNEIVINEKTGYLIDLDDDKEMANKIIHLLENNDLAESMGKNGRKHISENFNIEKNIKILENLYFQYS